MTVNFGSNLTGLVMNPGIGKSTFTGQMCRSLRSISFFTNSKFDILWKDDWVDGDGDRGDVNGGSGRFLNMFGLV